MENNKLKFPLRMVLIVLGLSALGFQLVNFIFGTLVKRSLDRQSELEYYIGQIVPHLATIMICIWFVVHLIKLINNKK